jgi:signal peptidase I
MIKENPKSNLFHICCDEISRGKKITIRAFGNSMFPAIKKGQQIQLIPFNIESLLVGEIIAFHRHGHFIVHRIVQIHTDEKLLSFTTQGDSNLRSDEVVNETNYIAKVLQANGDFFRTPIPKMTQRMIHSCMSRFFYFLDTVKNRLKKLMYRFNHVLV